MRSAEKHHRSDVFFLQYFSFKKEFKFGCTSVSIFVYIGLEEK